MRCRPDQDVDLGYAFTIAQVLLGLRTDLAHRAQCDVLEVSLDLMIRWMPRLAQDGQDPTHRGLG